MGARNADVPRAPGGLRIGLILATLTLDFDGSGRETKRVVIAGQLSQTIAGVTELGIGDDRMARYISSTPSTSRTVTISMATAREICA